MSKIPNSLTVGGLRKAIECVPDDAILTWMANGKVGWFQAQVVHATPDGVHLVLDEQFNGYLKGIDHALAIIGKGPAK